MLPDTSRSIWTDVGAAGRTPTASAAAGRPPPRRSRGGLVSTLVAAAAFGFVIAVVPDGQRRVSIDLWLVGVSAWAGLALTRRALEPVPMRSTGLRPALWLRTRRDGAPIRRPRGVGAVEGSLVVSSDNPRSYDHRLRPRLRAIADHQLRVNHGIDPAETDRVAAVLGDLAWLVDDAPADRPPTVDEIDRLLDRLGQADPGPAGTVGSGDRRPDDGGPIGPEPDDRPDRRDQRR